MVTAAPPQIIPRVAPKAPPGAGLGIEGAPMSSAPQPRVLDKLRMEDAQQTNAERDERFRTKVEAFTDRQEKVKDTKGALRDAAEDMDQYMLEPQRAEIAATQAKLAAATTDTERQSLEKQLAQQNAKLQEDVIHVDHIAAASRLNSPDDLRSSSGVKQAGALSAAEIFYQDRADGLKKRIDLVRNGKLGLKGGRKEFSQMRRDWNEMRTKQERAHGLGTHMSEMADIDQFSLKQGVRDSISNGLGRAMGDFARGADWALATDPTGDDSRIVSRLMRTDFIVPRIESPSNVPFAGQVREVRSLIELGDPQAEAQARSLANKLLEQDRLAILNEPVQQAAEQAKPVAQVATEQATSANGAQPTATEIMRQQAEAAAEWEIYQMKHGNEALGKLNQANIDVSKMNDDQIMAEMKKPENGGWQDNADTRKYLKSARETHEQQVLGKRMQDVELAGKARGLTPDQQRQANAIVSNDKNVSIAAAIAAVLGLVAGGPNNETQSQVNA